MIRIQALNEESSEESDEEEVHHQVTREAQEDQAVAQYKEALELQRLGQQQEAAAKLRELVATTLLQEVEKSPVQQYQPLLALKYSCLKNLAGLELKEGRDNEALECYLQALHLDDTDPTLLYKVGCLAEKLNRFDLAAVSFHEGLQCSPNHWLCLDRLITVLFATNGYLTCLSYVAKGLQKDPEYPKCLVLRDAMLKESPSLEQHYKDFFPQQPLLMDGKADEETTKEILEEAFDVRRRWSAAGKVKERGPIGLTRPLEAQTWLTLAEEILRLFKYINMEGIDASSAQTVDFEKVEEIADQSIFDEKEEEVEEESEEDASKKQGEEDNEESSANGSRKHRKRLFLENWMLGGQRRSARVRSTVRKDDETSLADSLKRLVPMSLLPDSLREGGTRMMLDENSMDTMDMFKMFEEKQHVPSSKVSTRRPSANTAASIAESIAKEEYFGTEAETKEVTDFIEQHRDNWGIYNLATDFTKQLAEKVKLTWPHKLVTVWIECYQVMRMSLAHVNPLSGEQSDEELEADGRVSLLHAELLVERLQRQKKSQPPMVLLEDVAQLQLMFCWSAEEALRINWIRVHAALLRKDTEAACNALRAVIDQLEPFPEGLRLINCKSCITVEDAESLLSSLECSQSLAGAEQLWREGQWKRLAELLEGSFQVQSRNDFRHIQLEMFSDALVRLDDPVRSFGWLEASLHEAVGHYLNGQQPHWAKCIEKMLAAAVYCSEEVGAEAAIGALSPGRLSRLFQDLCQVVCAQLETTDMVMPIETVDPWILLQQVLAFEERHKTPGEQLETVDEEEADEIPASISVLFVAHEHLGKRSWCCADQGELLLYSLEQIIPKLRSTEFASFRTKLTPHIEQMFYCLYEYPTSKRPKGKAFQEHNVPHVELTFETAQLLLDFYRPDALPQFDAYRVDSISPDAEALLKKIISLAPAEYAPQKTLELLRLYVEGQADKLPEPQHTLLPPGVRDVNYLLADHYFKNNDLPKAVRYYMLDLCHNPDRLDAWAGMALARASQLETQLNSCNAVNETDFIKRAEKAERCFERVLQLSGGRHTVICIEYGSFVYMLHSFCSRLLKQATDTLSLEQFELLETKKNSSLDTAEICFRKAMAGWTQGAEDDQDERWLHHYMLGKVSEKRHQQPWQALDQYGESARLLLEHKSAYPPKINYTNPSELSIEALEVHYRIHSCLLKHIESYEGRTLPDEQRVRRILKEQRDGPFGPEGPEAALKRKSEAELVVEEPPKKAKPTEPTADDDHARRVSQESSTTVTTSTSTSTSSSSSSSDDSSSSSTDAEDKPKQPEPQVEKPEPFDPKKDHAELIALCAEALHECFVRFPENFKPQYRLAHYYFKSKLHKNLAKCKELLLGPHPNAKLHGLFQDRKPSNFFNGVWRIPINEIDRPGSFASHMGRSLILTMELVKETKDYNMLVEMSLQLKRTPDPDKKYLRDNERKDLSEQAIAMAAQVMRQVVRDTKPEDLANLIIEIYKLLQKVQRTQITKEPHVFGRLLCDAFSLLTLGKIDAKATTIEAATKFAQQELARIKSAAKAAERAERAAVDFNAAAASVSSAPVTEASTPVTPVTAAAPSVIPQYQPPRKPYVPGTSRRGRPPLSRPPGTTTGRGRAKSNPNPYQGFFNNPFSGMDAASISYLQGELVRQMLMQGYSNSLTQSVVGGSNPSMAALSAAMPSVSAPTPQAPMHQPPAHQSPMQKFSKSRPSLSVTPIGGGTSSRGGRGGGANKTVKKLLEQSRKMLETAGRMHQRPPPPPAPLQNLPPGIVASAVPKSSMPSTSSAQIAPPPAKKSLLSSDSPLTLTKLPSRAPTAPMRPRHSMPVEITKRPMGRPPQQASWGPRPQQKRHPAPAPAHQSSRPRSLGASDFHFPSDISVMPSPGPSVIQHTKQFNLPPSISVSPAVPKPPQQQPPRPQQPPKEPPKRKPSDDIIILD